MLLLVDAYTASRIPRTWTTVPESSITVVVFDSFVHQTDLVEQFERHRPDIILLHESELTPPAFLYDCARRGNCAHTRVVLAADNTDDLTVVIAGHRDFYDVVQLGVTDAALQQHLCEIREGSTRLYDNPIWQRIPLPVSRTATSSSVLDFIDRAILQLIAVGLRDQDIAQVLHYSTQSIKNRVSTMLREGNVANRTLLATRAAQDAAWHERA